MNVVYIVDFPVSGNSGKEKATREKSRAIADNDGIDQFTFISDKRRRGLAHKIFGKFIFDISTAIRIIPVKNSVVIQRVIFLPITRIVLLLKGIKIISEFHADLQEEIPLITKSAFQKLLLQIAAKFYNLNFKLSHAIIYNHPYLKYKFDSVYKKPSIFTYNGSNHKEYYPVEQNLSRKKLNINSSSIIFLFLGSVSQWHGVDYLIRIFNNTNVMSRDDIWLYIVGASENYYTSELVSKINNDHITFIPPVDTKTANLYINSSDFCLLPVKQVRTSPGSPLKLYDYIACGKPVITQENLAGYSDEIEKYNLGYTLDFADTEKSVERILLILDRFSEEDKNTYLKNNRSIAMNECSWTKRMEGWVNFIKYVSES